VNPIGWKTGSGAMTGALVRALIGAVLLEAHDEWLMQRRYMGVEAMGELFSPR
jgi:hypothetical protein